MINDFCPLKCSTVSDFLAVTGNRDKMLAVVQYAPIAFEYALRATTGDKVTESLVNIAGVSDFYRTFTRFSRVIDMLDERKLKAIAANPDPISRSLQATETALSCLFFPCEHVFFLQRNNVMTVPFERSNQSYFWFWFLTTTFVKHCYNIFVLSKNTEMDKKTKKEKYTREILGATKTMCYIIFSLSIQGTHDKPPALFPNSANPLCKAVNAIQAATKPVFVPMTKNTRAQLGLTSTMIDLYLMFGMRK